MKRSLFFGLFAVLLFSNFVLAQNVTSEFGAIKGTLDQQTEDVFSREIVFPESLGFLSYFFGETVSVERLVVLFGIWVALFVLIRAVIDMIPMFDNEKIKSWMAVVVVLLILVSGVIDNLSTMYFEYLDTLKFMAKLGIFRYITGVGLFVIIAYVLKGLSDRYKKELAFTAADVTGERLRMGAERGRIESQMMNKDSMVTPKRPFWRK